MKGRVVWLSDSQRVSLKNNSGSDTGLTRRVKYYRKATVWEIIRALFVRTDDDTTTEITELRQ